jgi:hypothetical protein
METSSKRGKIPQKDWPLIIKRYEAGETLAAIARTYDCSPPAISYILSRSRPRHEITDSAGPHASEPLQPGSAKTPPGQPLPSPAQPRSDGDGIALNRVEAQTPIPVEQVGPDPLQPNPSGASNQQGDAADERIDLAAPWLSGPPHRRDEIPHPPDQPGPGNPGSADPVRSSALPQRGEPRGILHLSLPQHGSHQPDPQLHEARHPGASESGDMRRMSGQQHTSFIVPGPEHPGFYPATNASVTVRAGAEVNRAAEGGTFIDRVLRERVNQDIAAFLAAFDAALADDSLESRAALRQATDRLLRAGARTRIELERLEARVPLPAREKMGHSGPTWRPR